MHMGEFRRGPALAQGGLDEGGLVLTLSLFVRHGASPPPAEVRKLSEQLRRMPVESHLAQDPSFRSEAAVHYKLANFLALQTDGASGYAHTSELDRVVFSSYIDSDALFADAEQIEQALREVAALPAATTAIVDAEADDQERMAGFEVEEGRLLARLHWVRERKASIVQLKKRQAMKSGGRLACEVCDMDFESEYGARGSGFIEAHHTTPLSELTASRKTRAQDLALLCSNCHRMIHRSHPWMTVDELRDARALHTADSAASESG